MITSSGRSEIRSAVVARIPGEGAQSLSSAYGEQPWLGDAFGSFTNSPARLPVDTHEMVTMVAPRGLFIIDNPHITNLGPRSASRHHPPGPGNLTWTRRRWQRPRSAGPQEPATTHFPAGLSRTRAVIAANPP